MPPRSPRKWALQAIENGKWNAQQVAERSNTKLTQNAPRDFVIRLALLL